MGTQQGVHDNDCRVESIGQALDIPLAHEAKPVTRHVFTDSEDEQAYQMTVQALADTAAREKKLWHEYQSTLNERFHNAAVSLAFVLKTSVFLNSDVELDGRRASALKDFVELVDWASPHQWNVRTDMVRDVLLQIDEIVMDEVLLIEIVEEHQSRLAGGGESWGNIESTRWTKRGTLLSIIGWEVLNQ